MQDEGEFSMRDAFAKALRDRADEIRREAKLDGTDAGSAFGPMVIDDAPRYPIGLAPLKIHQRDGRDRVVLIEARFDRRTDLVTTTESVSWSDNDPYWQAKLDLINAGDTSYLIVNHKMYHLGGDTRDGQGKLLPGGGFGGRLIRFYRITWVGDPFEAGSYRVLGYFEETRNLWYNGVIPLSWQGQLFDNAAFEGDFDGPVQC